VARSLIVRPPREVEVVWALVAASLVAILVTYSRLPASQLYDVSGSGLRGGLSRDVVELNFPDALVALAIVAVARVEALAAAAAALLCLVFALPGVVQQANLDAKWINAVPALGVALAFVLSLRASGPASPGRARGDVARVVLAAVLVVLASPWIAAELGFYLDGVPVLGWLFQTGKLAHFHNPLHHAVHHGVHHGLQGLLLALTALLLSRLPSGRGAKAFLSLLLAYGVANVANDAWLEQVAERGWSSTSLPSVLGFSPNWLWLAVLVVAAAVWLLWFGQPSREASTA